MHWPFHHNPNTLVFCVLQYLNKDNILFSDTQCSQCRTGPVQLLCTWHWSGGKTGSSQEQVPALKSLKVWKARKKSNIILNKTNHVYFYGANQIWFRLFVLERERSLATFFGVLFFGFATGTGLEVLVLRSRILSQWPHDCGYSWADVDPLKGKGKAGVIASMMTW